MSPKVSVCIPVYNGGGFIEETIESVLAQTFGDFEVIVIDNCSTDDTAMRVECFDDHRVSLVRASEHVDAIANFRRAIALCTGQYVKLLCADDTLAKRCLEDQVRALDAHPTAALAASRRDIVDEEGRLLIRDRGLRGLRGLVPGPAAIARCVRRGTNLMGEPGTVLIRAETLEQAGTWSDRWPYMVDLEMWFRLLRFGDLVALPETHATFRVHTSGWSAEMGRTQAAQARRLFSSEAQRPGSGVTRRDLVVGSGRAQLLQYGRRALYLWRDRKSRRSSRRRRSYAASDKSTST